MLHLGLLGFVPNHVVKIQRRCMTLLSKGHEMEYHLVIPLLFVTRISQSVYFCILQELIDEK